MNAEPVEPAVLLRVGAGAQWWRVAAHHVVAGAGAGVGTVWWDVARGAERRRVVPTSALADVQEVLNSVGELLDAATTTDAHVQVEVAFGPEPTVGPAALGGLRVVLPPAGAACLRSGALLSGDAALCRFLRGYWWHALPVCATKGTARWPSQMPRLRDGLFPHQKEAIAWMRAREEEFGGGGLMAAVPTHVPLGSTGRHVVRDARAGCAWIASAPSAPRHWPVHGAVLDWAPRAGVTTTAQAFVASVPPFTEPGAAGDTHAACGLLRTGATLVVVNRASVDVWVSAVRARAAEGASVLGICTLRDWSTVSAGEFAGAQCVVVSRGFVDGVTYAHRAGLAMQRVLGTRQASVRDLTAVRCAAARYAADMSPVPLEAVQWPRVVVDDAHRVYMRAPPEWLRGLSRRFTWLVGNGLGRGATVQMLGEGELLEPTDAHHLDARLRHIGPRAPPVACVSYNCALSRAEHRVVDERRYCPLYTGTVGAGSKPLLRASDAVERVRDATAATCAALRQSADRHEDAARRQLAEAHADGNRTDAEVALLLQQGIEREHERTRLVDHAAARERQGSFCEAQLRDLATTTAARCPICTEDHTVVAFSACGHYTCEECAARLRERAEGFPQCPECRCHIDDHLVWRIAVGPAADGACAEPCGSRAAALVKVLREAPRALVVFPTEELARLAHTAVAPHVQATRVIGTAAQRARAVARLLDVNDEPACLFVTPGTEYAGLPRCGITDVVLYAALPPDETRRAVAAATVLGPGSGARVTLLQ